MKELIGSEARHKTNNHLATIWFDIAESKQSDALTNQRIEFMQKDLSDVKSLLEKFIQKAEENFATKAELNNIKGNVEKHSTYFFWTVTSLIWIIIIWIVKLLFPS